MRNPRLLSLSLAAVALGTAVLLGLRPEGGSSRAVAPAPRPRLGGVVPDRNRVNLTARNLPDTWDAEKGTNVRWSAEVGSKAYGGPIVAGGKVYVGTNNKNPRDPAVKGDRGVLMCFDEKTGKFLWQLVHDKLPQGQVNDWPEEGIASSPAVEDDRLYYVSNRAEVVCADVNGDPAKPGQGKVLWTYDMIAKDNVFPHNLAVCSPLVVGKMVYVVTANGVHQDHITVPSPEAPSFLCLDTEGKFVWKSNLPSQSLVEAKKAGGAVKIRDLVNKGKLLMHGQWSNPVYAEVKGKPQVIFPGGDGWIYAFKPDSKDEGELLWKFDCNPKDAFYQLGPAATRNDFIGTPVVHDNKLYIGVGQDPEHKEGVGHLWCIDITKEPKNKDRDLSPAARILGKNLPPETILDARDPANKDSGLVWHYGGFVPQAERRKVKRNYYFGRSMSTCAVHDGLLYTADLDGYIYCFDARTGEKQWDYNTRAAIWGSPYYADGKVFIGTDDQVMYVFKHGRKKEDPTEIDMPGKFRMWHTVENDTLFLLTESKTRLYAIARK